MKVLIGYMMFSSACLLGVLGGNLWYTAIEIYRWAVDKFTFTMAVYNFCIVGVISIFWAKGVPTFVTQGYLVATSVILAWQLAHFDACTFLKCYFIGPTLYHSHASELTRQC
jgi:presenilin 1